MSLKRQQYIRACDKKKVLACEIFIFYVAAMQPILICLTKKKCYSSYEALEFTLEAFRV